jgi:hypothetical protein
LGCSSVPSNILYRHIMAKCAMLPRSTLSRRLLWGWPSISSSCSSSTTNGYPRRATGRAPRCGAARSSLVSRQAAHRPQTQRCTRAKMLLSCMYRAYCVSPCCGSLAYGYHARHRYEKDNSLSGGLLPQWACPVTDSRSAPVVCFAIPSQQLSSWRIHACVVVGWPKPRILCTVTQPHPCPRRAPAPRPR